MTTLSLVPDPHTTLISAIRNLVCPLCGGSMMEFRCLGVCRGNWRQEWEWRSEKAKRTKPLNGRRTRSTRTLAKKEQ